MRKKVWVVLALMACLLMQMVPVFAAGVSVAELDAIGVPADGHIISSAGLVGDSNGWSFGDLSGDSLSLSLGMYGEYKMIAYSPITGLYYYYADGEVVYDDEVPVVMEGIQSSSSLETAYSKVYFCTTGCPSFIIPNDMSAYLLVFRDNVSVHSINDALYACKVSDLTKYVIDEKEFNVVNPGTSGAISVTLIDKIIKDAKVVGARYRCDYKIGTCEIYGKTYNENPTFLYVNTINRVEVKDKVGSVEFEIPEAYNMEYTAYIETDMGSKYSTKFVVDFVDDLQFEPSSLSDAKPVVEFEGIPTDGSKLSEPLQLTMKTLNVPSRMYINGSEISTMYCNSCEVTITENGRYSYSAVTELGVVTDGFITIDCMESDVSMSSFGLNKVDSSLVQTGFDVTRSPVVYIFVAVAVILIGTGAVVVYKSKRGI